MKLGQQPWSRIVWTDGQIDERPHDDGEAMLRHIRESVGNDPHVAEVRTFSKPAPLAPRSRS